MRKQGFIIGIWIVLTLLFAACHSSVVEREVRTCGELEDIDSLMWKHPDSWL